MSYALRGVHLMHSAATAQTRCATLHPEASSQLCACCLNLAPMTKSSACKHAHAFVLLMPVIRPYFGCSLSKFMASSRFLQDGRYSFHSRFKGRPRACRAIA